jgi:hypothetical protein
MHLQSELFSHTAASCNPGQHLQIEYSKGIRFSVYFRRRLNSGLSFLNMHIITIILHCSQVFCHSDTDLSGEESSRNGSVLIKRTGFFVGKPPQNDRKKQVSHYPVIAIPTGRDQYRTRTMNNALNGDGSPRPDQSGLAMTKSGGRVGTRDDKFPSLRGA